MKIYSSENFYTTIINSTHQISKSTWNNLADFKNVKDGILVGNPFLSHEFFTCLEDSGSISYKTGWVVQHIILKNIDGLVVGILPNFLKTHSWGEYVFDHIFADVWQRHGKNYYPKLLSAIPFTPITGPRFLLSKNINQKHAIQVLLSSLKKLVEDNKLSSSHINFIDHKQACHACEDPSWLKRYGIQFHWKNDNYENFEGFLSNLSSSKRKVIRKERREINSKCLKIKKLTGDEIKEKHIESFYNFYVNTSEKKFGAAYLTRDFWFLLISRLKHRVLLILVFDNKNSVAGAINLFDNKSIYGRNWGSLVNVNFLHFEVCYYQAIEFAITKKLETVEAGAQGIHKIQRGYYPTTTQSIHYFFDKEFAIPISKFLKIETNEIKKDIISFEKRLPYKNL